MLSTEQTFFLPFIQTVLINLGLEKKVFAIYGSLVGRGCICLMISLIYKGRALPLVFTAVKGNKGHLPENTHMELVNKLLPLVKVRCEYFIDASACLRLRIGLELLYPLRPFSLRGPSPTT